MAVADWAGVVGGVAGVGSLVVAVFAYKAAQKGNELAAVANNTATDAIGQAQAANRIAVEANDLAGNANSIAERALIVAQDDVPYNWVLQIDEEGHAAVVNDCGHRADQTTVTIDAGGKPIVDAGPVDVAEFPEIALSLDSAVQEHFERVAQKAARPARTTGDTFYFGSAGEIVETRFRAHLRWLTENGVLRSDVVEQVLRHHMTADGPRVPVPRRQRS